MQQLLPCQNALLATTKDATEVMLAKMDNFLLFNRALWGSIFLSTKDIADQPLTSSLLT